MKEEGVSSEPKKPAGRSRFQFRILDLIGLNILIAVNMLVWHVLIKAGSVKADIEERVIASSALTLAFTLGAAYLTYRLVTERKIESPLRRLELLLLMEFYLVAGFLLIGILIAMILGGMRRP